MNEKLVEDLSKTIEESSGLGSQAAREVAEIVIKSDVLAEIKRITEVTEEVSGGTISPPYQPDVYDLVLDCLCVMKMAVARVKVPDDFKAWNVIKLASMYWNLKGGDSMPVYIFDEDELADPYIQYYLELRDLELLGHTGIDHDFASWITTERKMRSDNVSDLRDKFLGIINGGIEFAENEIAAFNIEFAENEDG